MILYRIDTRFSIGKIEFYTEDCIFSLFSHEQLELTSSNVYNISTTYLQSTWFVWILSLAANGFEGEAGKIFPSFTRFDCRSFVESNGGGGVSPPRGAPHFVFFLQQQENHSSQSR